MIILCSMKSKTSSLSPVWNLTCFAVACLLAILLVSCGKRADATLKTIRVGYLPMVSSLTYFVALEKGYFEEEKIDVRGTPIKTSNGIAQDLVAGNIDAAIELSIVPLLKMSENAPPKFRVFSISAITETNGFDGVLVRADSPITSLDDLSGK